MDGNIKIEMEPKTL